MARIPGPQAGTLAHNRRFWDDPYVEPKQQHRFAVNFPVYMPMGPGDDSAQQAAKYFTNTPKISTSQIEKIKSKMPAGSKELPAATDTGNIANLLPMIVSALPGDDEIDKARQAQEIVNGVFGALGSRPQGNAPHFMVGPKGARYGGYGRFTSQTSGLYLRISEYIGYSFTPPAIQFTQGFDANSNAGNPIPNDALNKYNLGDATLTLVTTLRDDLHFSLNFLFAVGAAAGSSAEGSLKSPTKLYPTAVYAGDMSDRVLVIKEYSARQDAAGTGGPGGSVAFAEARAAGKTPAQIFGNAPARIVGIHKLNDPVIKSATFDEFTYGGTNLVKVTLVLGYGTTTGMAGFYSYETTTSRYQRSYFTWQDDTDSQKDSVPDFNKRKLKAFREYPNWWSKDRVMATQKLNAIKAGYPTKPGQGSARTGPSLPAPAAPIDIGTNKRRLDFIRDTIEKGEPIPINELVTKGVAELLEAKEAAERTAAAEAEAVRKREQDQVDRNNRWELSQELSRQHSEEIRQSNMYFEERERRKAESQAATDARIAKYQEEQRLEQRVTQGDDRRVEGAGRIGSGRDPVRSRREEVERLERRLNQGADSRTDSPGGRVVPSNTNNNNSE